MDKIRILLAEDHAVVRAGLRLLINGEGDMEVVGEASDGLEAVQKAKELLPSIILMDITMPGLNGLEATRQIRKENPHTKVLILTMHLLEEYFFQALRAGASGYVPKSASGDEMLEAIRAANEGQFYIHPSVQGLLVSDYLERAKAGEPKDVLQELTDREREILHLVVAGHSNREIAELLHLSVNTVHNHRARLMEKLGVKDRMELLRFAIRRGLISVDSPG